MVDRDTDRSSSEQGQLRTMHAQTGGRRREQRRPVRRAESQRHKEQGTRPTLARVEDRRGDPWLPAHPARSDHAPGDRRRGGTPWWIWLLGVVGIGLIAFMVLQGAETDSSRTTEAVDSGTQSSGGSAEPGAGGSVVSGDTDLLALSGDPQGLAEYGDHSVQAKSVQVQSVIADEGFWVGPSEQLRLFVFLSLAGESGPRIDAGDTVSFSGTMKRLPLDFEDRFAVSATDGAGQLLEQGSYLEVTDIEQH